MELTENNFKNSVKEIELTNIEKEIINEFLKVELEKSLYKKYRDQEIVVIEEALKKLQSIDTYLYSLTDWNSMNKIKKCEDINNIYFLDSTQIKKIKNEIENEIVYHWKESDFNAIKTKMLKQDEFRKIINDRLKETLPMKSILYLSLPLIINHKNAMISFEIGNFQWAYHSTNHFTVLMRKVNNKWVQNNFYDDGVYD